MWSFSVCTSSILEELLVWVVLVGGLWPCRDLLSSISLFVGCALRMLDNNIVLLKEGVHPGRWAWIFGPTIVQLNVSLALRGTAQAWLMRWHLLLLGGLLGLISFNGNSPVVVYCIVLLLLRPVGRAWVLLQPLIVAHIGERLMITVVMNQRLRGLMIVWRVRLRSFIRWGYLLVVVALNSLPRLLVIRAIAIGCAYSLSPALTLSYFSSCNVNNRRSILLPRSWRTAHTTVRSVGCSLFVKV